MPKGKFKILKADDEIIILEATIGTDYRFSIPTSIRDLIDPREKVRITIEKAK